MLLRMLGRATIQSTFVLSALVFLMLVTATAATPEYKAPEVEVVSIKDPEISAKSWAVVDVANDKMILSHNETSSLPVASITKLITAAAVWEDFDHQATTTITWTDVAAEGRSGSLVPGDIFSYHKLLFPLLLESSNDAAEALENAADEGELQLAMNDYVARFDLQNTVFVDSSGLSPKNTSTARNLASLASDLYFDQPHLLDITGLNEYLYEDYGWQNNSPFIGDAGYLGGKHGYLPEANRTALVYFKETYPKNETAVVAYVVLGSDDLVSDIRALRELVRTTTVYQ